VGYSSHSLGGKILMKVISNFYSKPRSRPFISGVLELQCQLNYNEIENRLSSSQILEVKGETGSDNNINNHQRNKKLFVFNLVKFLQLLSVIDVGLSKASHYDLKNECCCVRS
jgi:hypothetical protein